MQARRLPLAWFLLLAVILLAVMALELFMELEQVQQPFDVMGAHVILNSCTRALNQLVQLTFVSVALAVPISATGYTPKLIWLFIGDRMHQIALGYYALAAVHANWVLFLVRHEPVPMGLVSTVLCTTLLGFVAVVPYFFYVIRFLEPRTVVVRIHDMSVRVIRSALRSPAGLATARRLLPRHLAQLGSVVLKAIDRLDRRSVVQGVEAIRTALQAYGQAKDRLSAAWFEVGNREFPGLSPDALAFIARDRSWIEVGAHHQLVQAYEYSLNRLPDAVSALAAALRQLALDARERGDHPGVENSIRTLNTFLRIGIRRNQPHALYDTLIHYHALAQDLTETHPDLMPRIADHFAYYGSRAKEARMAFMPELFAYDLGGLTVHLASVKSSTTPRVLETLVDYLRTQAETPSVALTCAALATLSGLLDRLSPEGLAPLVHVLEQVPSSVRARALEVLEQTTEPRYWEMTDRQADFNYLHPEQREALRTFVEAHGLADPSTRAALRESAMWKREG